MKQLKMFAISIVCFSLHFAFAAEMTTTTVPSAVKDDQNFEIIDGSAQVAGDPDILAQPAQKKWKKACDEWRKEFKELNQANKNQVISLSCGTPVCSTADGASTICSSNATYKIKTIGVQVKPQTPTTPPEIPKISAPEGEIMTAPPTPIVEIVPPVRSGYVWISGYWGWSGLHHVWYPGHWELSRPGYVWIHETWRPHGHGWRFYGGHWDHL